MCMEALGDVVSLALTIVMAAVGSIATGELMSQCPADEDPTLKCLWNSHQADI